MNAKSNSNIYIKKESNNISEYNEIIKRYQNGEYGSEHLSLDQILSKAGNPNLLRKMSIEELDILIDSSSGITRELFLMIKKQKQSN